MRPHLKPPRLRTVLLVVNLTIPAAHVDVGVAALEAGKHVWAEKPLALDRESGRKLLDSAQEKGLRVASAPDTVLGAGIQTARRAIEDGRVGEPRTALAMFQTPGTPRRSSCSRPAAGHCSTWGRTT
jgi:predicted dehydrogenase